MVLSKYFITFVLVASAALTSGCTKEDNEDCSGFNLTFEFTHNMDEANKFGELVNRARVYFFDENDVLRIYALDNGKELKYEYLHEGQVKTVSKPNLYGSLPDNYVMSFTDLPPGKYKVFSFCGSNNGDNTTYFHGHMNSAETHDFEPGVTLGRTTMADFRLFLSYREATEYKDDDIIPTADEIDDLWYGAVGTRQPQQANYAMELVEIKHGQIVNKHIDLVRNTNIIKFTVSGIENLLGGNPSSKTATRQPSQLDRLGYEIWIRANNGRYKADNSAGENARTIRYHPHFVQTDSNKIVVDLKTLRLNTPKQDLQPMTLYFVSADKRVTKSIDVLKVITAARDADGNLLYPDIESMFKEYIYPIEIKIGYDLSIRIFIKDWEVVNVVPVE